jgi:nucleosome binding factor SPN SPT16 subunit
MVGESNDEVQYSKSSALQTWLFNCSLPDTLLIMTKTGIYFLGSERKAQFFSPLENKDSIQPLSHNVPAFTILNRDKVTEAMGDASA